MTSTNARAIRNYLRGLALTATEAADSTSQPLTSERIDALHAHIDDMRDGLEAIEGLLAESRKALTPGTEGQTNG